MNGAKEADKQRHLVSHADGEDTAKSADGLLATQEHAYKQKIKRVR
jgi:hypothetical protein